MINHGIAIIGIAIAAFLSVASGASAPAAKPAYPSGTELYPAVYGTFSQLYPNARYLDINFYNNSYTLTGITGLALTTPISYDMTVRLTPTGEIDISYANIYQKDTSTGRWGKAEAFGLYNYNKAVSDITEKMLAIANDQAEFGRQEKAAMADIKFIFAVMKDFTGLAFGEFIEKYAKGSVFNISGPISDVKESGREIDGTTYKYLVTLTEKLSGENSDYYFSSLLSDYVYCRLYTNEDSVIRLSKTSVLTVKGSLIGASQGGVVGASLYLDLVEVK
jgi:hypothetical protein